MSGSISNIVTPAGIGTRTTDSAGNSSYRGQYSFDTVVINEGRRAATVSPRDAGVIRITHDGGRQVDTIQNIGQLRFLDGTVAYKDNSASAQVKRLYLAAFGRQPDQAGLQFWTNALQGGTPSSTLASNLLASAEFSQRFGTLPDTTQLLVRLHNNAQGNDGSRFDPGQLRGQIDAGAITRGQALVQIAEAGLGRLQDGREDGSQWTTGVWQPNQKAEQVARLYDTTLARLADAQGLGFWTRAMDSGTSLESVATAFLNSAEFRSEHGNLDNMGFASVIYGNTFDVGSVVRASIGDLIARLDGGETRGHLAASLSEHPRHQEIMSGSIISRDPSSPGIQLL